LIHIGDQTRCAQVEFYKATFVSSLELCVLVGLIALLVIVLYWELVIAEGVHLGSEVVVRLYDWAAPRYESIKRFQPEFEDICIGVPLAKAMASCSGPVVLDVAAGTGRLARTLLRQSGFNGRVLALDKSEPMLRQIGQHIPRHCEQVEPLLGWADCLPFASNTFEAVACLEALEFTPNPPEVLMECVRVLRPGGQLLVSNRIGTQARWLLGKTMSSSSLKDLLTHLGLGFLRVDAWQLDYDLVWASKSSRILKANTE
jgi:ubiquinone/menaquinone biosynthesis C-methylase UbiE